MKFHKITFKNYRCFLTGEVEFYESDDRNINLIIGSNGCGKTELLFAFWWALYMFEFKKLRGKEDTPYALNSDLYKKLENSEIGSTETCYVIIKFEYEGVLYELKKSCDYRKTEKKIVEHEYQEFSSYNNNGALGLPIRDHDEIKKILNKIIPMSILYGIIFDGERMQKLSSIDETSKNAIEGVISDITNVALIENCIETFNGLKSEISKTAKQLAKQVGQYELEDILQRLTDAESDIIQCKENYKNSKIKLDNINAELESISSKLQNYKEARILEEKRKAERQNIDKERKRLEEHYKNLSATLKNGYILDCSELFDEVNKVITQYDVPEGLTVQAVNSILQRSTCICGTPMDKDMIKFLKDLICTLPPDNVNSTLAEIIRQMRVHALNIKESARKDYNNISESENSIKQSKDNIVYLSTQIVEGSEEEAKKLEKENEILNQEKGELKSDIPKLETKIKKLESEIEEYQEIRAALTKNSSELKIYNLQMAFIEKCLKAIFMIKENNKSEALKVINDKLGKAYKLLSEDYELGRKIHIVQYSKEKRYQMAVYLQTNFDETLRLLKANGTYNELINDGLSEDEINEIIILRCMDSNSTGQSKMNTLSFVKAILDYSNEPKDVDSFEVRKEYPLLIDAPFGDIFDQNLIKSSRELHAFTDQIILMLSKESYQGVESQLGQYVSCIYKLSKIENNNHSVINRIRGDE